MTGKKNRRKKLTASRPKAKKIKRVHTGEFVDKDLSLLEFNKRVLEQAMDQGVPLLERLRFLSIFHSNLDEFYMKRVDISRRVKIYNVLNEGGEEKTVTYEQHKLIRKAVINLQRQASECYTDSLVPELKEKGIQLVEYKDLTASEKKKAEKIFEEKIFPILTPLAVDPGHPFPHISNLSTSLAVSLRYPDQPELYFARVKVPKGATDWINLQSEKADEIRFLSLQSLIEHNLDKLFPNMKITGIMPFRLTRNIELEKEDEEPEDILEMIEQVLKERRFGDVVKLEVPTNPDPWLLKYLVAELGLSEDDVYEMQSLIDFTDLGEIANLDIPEYRFQPWTPVLPEALADSSDNIFKALSQSDALVHHPYESFTASVENLIHSATEDPNVLAIKITLYRTAEDSALIRSLIHAAESGKQVVCLIELKARMDEARNIHWAQKLEEAGVHIVYGIVGLKTHSKTTLIVRQEDKGIKCYVHIGTGNYNSTTAKLYTDLGLMTCNPEITREVVELFHHLTGRSYRREYKQLLVAPSNLRSRFEEMIERETANAKKGKRARIIAKCNGLDDRKICKKLYEASQAGVKVDLIVRGLCIAKPGVKGMSENIRVISVVDRFLEHSRVYYFENNTDASSQPEFYMGSADWMGRNLDRRVEVCTPLYNPIHKERLMFVLETMLNDKVQAWEMNSEGGYKRLKPTQNDAQASGQMTLMLETLKRALRDN